MATMRINILFIILVLVFSSSCSSDKRKEKKNLSVGQIEKMYSSGVVLIKNTYYYSIDFEDKMTVYFTGLDEDGDIEGATMNVEEVNPVTAFGTGFFVSKDGLLATNSHVACPSVSISDARGSIVSAFQTLSELLQDQINDYNVKLGELSLLIDAGNSSYMGSYKMIESRRDSCQFFVNCINRLNVSDYEVSRHCDIGIALNNTHVSSLNDFLDCVTIENDAEHDLALIQLKDKETPQKCHVFDVHSDKSRQNSNRDRKTRNSAKNLVGKSLYMIGYNWGPSLGLTKEGVKVQITKGEVTQDTDADKLMYSIPALQGSSGSPILSKTGELVAVNFAGISTSQSFNFGIKAYHLKRLIDEYKD